MTTPTTCTTATGTDPGQLLHHALAHAARGWHVFPLRPDTKRPAVTAWPTRATTDPNRITRCWTPAPGNPARWGIALATGPSGLVVVDLDQDKTDPTAPTGSEHLADLASQHPASHDARDLATFTVRTASGGTHLYYLAPTGGQLRNTAGRLAPLVDTRACGGYVVAPGTTITGTPYVVTDRREPVPLPAWLTALLDPAPVPDRTQRSATSSRQRPNVDRYAAAALDRESRRVRAAQPGTRNAALFTAAVALGQLVGAGALTADEVTAALLGATADHVRAGAFTTHEAAGTIASGLRRGSAEPRTLPRTLPRVRAGVHR